jgi:hypothetical protein
MSFLSFFIRSKVQPLIVYIIHFVRSLNNVQIAKSFVIIAFLPLSLLPNNYRRLMSIALFLVFMCCVTTLALFINIHYSLFVPVLQLMLRQSYTPCSYQSYLMPVIHHGMYLQNGDLLLFLFNELFHHYYKVIQRYFIVIL